MAQARTSAFPQNLTHWPERVDLAASFRWTARLNMHEGIANHYSLAVSDDGSRFLMNPNGRHFSRVKASELILIDADNPETMNRPDAPDPTAWAIHGAIHRRHPHARCIMHVHSKYATALACLKDPSLPPIDQNTMRFFERTIIDFGFDGMGLGDEAERLASLVTPDKAVMIMGNHGVAVIGRTVAETFDELYYFERACETYITALQTGRDLLVVSDAVARKTMRQWLDYDGFGDKHLSELKAILDSEASDYAS